MAITLERVAVDAIGYTSMTMKIALMATPKMKTRRKTRWSDVKRLVSKTERQMSPTPPMNEPRIARAAYTRPRLRIAGTSL